MSRDILLNLIDPDPDQPRKNFDQAKLAELAQSLEQTGLAVPILVRPNEDRFIIVHGERRYRAAALLGWATIPAEVREMEADEAKWLQLIENIQRDDLSPIEEGEAYQAALADGLTQKALGEKMGKTQSYIAQKLRMLKLPPIVKNYLAIGKVSEGQARQLLRLHNPQAITVIARQAVEDQLSVSALKEIVDSAKKLQICESRILLTSAESMIETAQTLSEAWSHLGTDEAFNQWVKDKFGWPPLYAQWLLSLKDKSPVDLIGHYEWIQRFMFGEARDVSLTDIVLDDHFRGRATNPAIDSIAVIEYTTVLKEGAIFPPLMAVEDDQGDLLLCDGFLRYWAHQKASHPQVCIKVEKGNAQDATWYGIGSNARHGMRPMNADKRRAVIGLLEDEEWGQWSDREIAQHCGVTSQVVHYLRESRKN